VAPSLVLTAVRAIATPVILRFNLPAAASVARPVARMANLPAIAPVIGQAIPAAVPKLTGRIVDTATSKANRTVAGHVIPPAILLTVIPVTCPAIRTAIQTAVRTAARKSEGARARSARVTGLQLAVCGSEVGLGAPAGSLHFRLRIVDFPLGGIRRLGVGLQCAAAHVQAYRVVVFAKVFLSRVSVPSTSLRAGSAAAGFIVPRTKDEVRSFVISTFPFALVLCRGVV